MKKITTIAVLLISVLVISEDCDKYKVQIDSLMAEFNAIKDKMTVPDITRDEYDDLNFLYNDTWSEIVELKKVYEKCTDSRKTVVKKKVEIRKLDYKLPGIMDVPWGTARNKVKETLRKRSDIKLVDTDESILEYTSGKFFEYNVEKWQYNFINGKLYACQIVLKQNGKTDVFSLYDKVSQTLENKYGEPSYRKNTIPVSYKDKNVKLNSLKNGSSSLYRKWLFKGDDMIRIKINETGSVLLTYLDNELYCKAQAE